MFVRERLAASEQLHLPMSKSKQVIDTREKLAVILLPQQEYNDQLCVIMKLGFQTYSKKWILLELNL